MRRPTHLIDENLEFKDGLDFEDTGFFFGGKISSNSRLFGPKWEGPIELRSKKGFLLKKEKLEEIGKYLLQGKTAHEIFRLVNVSRLTIQKLRKIIIYLSGEIYCGCGKPSNHKGMCGKRKHTGLCVNPKCSGNDKRYKSNWRCTGKKFGFNGKLCRPCYTAFYNKERRLLRNGADKEVIPSNI